MEKQESSDISDCFTKEMCALIRELRNWPELAWATMLPVIAVLKSALVKQ